MRLNVGNSLTVKTEVFEAFDLGAIPSSPSKIMNMPAWRNQHTRKSLKLNFAGASPVAGTNTECGRR